MAKFNCCSVLILLIIEIIYAPDSDDPLPISFRCSTMPGTSRIDGRGLGTKALMVMMRGTLIVS